MQRLFFHNRHDAESRAVFETLDLDVRVYDVFGADRYKLPQEIRLTALPYMVDKYFALLPGGPYLVDTPFELEIVCKDYQDNTVTEEAGQINVTIDGMSYSVNPENGICYVDIECPEPRTVTVVIEGSGYLSLEAEVEVVAGEG